MVVEVSGIQSTGKFFSPFETNEERSKEEMLCTSGVLRCRGKF